MLNYEDMFGKEKCLTLKNVLRIDEGKYDVSF